MVYQSIIFLRNFLAKWGWAQNVLAILMLNMIIQQWVWVYTVSHFGQSYTRLDIIGNIP